MEKSLNLVSYAVNGSGVGHLSRLVAVNRWLRRYASVAGVTTRHWFLTTSEADTWLFHEGFAAFKMPSKSLVEEAGIYKPTYLALAKQWVWHSLGLLRPDLLLVDTFPQGSFQELPSALDLCRHKALVLRPVKAEFAASPGYAAAVALYDRVIVPTSSLREGEEGDWEAMSALAAGRATRTGPILQAERFEALPRDLARRELGVPDDALCLLVTGGGGGDPTVAALFDAVLAEVADDPSIHVVLAAGPLYRGARRTGARVTWWTEPGLSRRLAGVDAAVSAAGFNTTHELLFFGVPTALVPQDKLADDQRGRASRLAARGAALDAPLEVPGALTRALVRLRDAGERAALSAAGQALVDDNQARVAAAELLKLLLPRGTVERAVDALDDDVLTAARRHDVPLDRILGVARALGECVDEVPVDLDAAIELLPRARDAGFPAERVPRLVDLVTRRFPTLPDVQARADAATRLMAHPATLGHSTALLSLLQLLSPLKEGPAAAGVDGLLELLDACLATGRGIGEVLRLCADGQELAPTPDAALLSALRAQLLEEPA